MQARADESDRLLSWGFREFDNYALFKAGDTVDEATVWLGAEETVPLVISQDLKVSLPRSDRDGMQVAVVYDGPIPAPIAAGQERSEEHTSELQSLMRISYAVFCLQKKKTRKQNKTH